jgi:hypothetical protein
MHYLIDRETKNIPSLEKSSQYENIFSVNNKEPFVRIIRFV